MKLHETQIPLLKGTGVSGPFGSPDLRQVQNEITGDPKTISLMNGGFMAIWFTGYFAGSER